MKTKVVSYFSYKGGAGRSTLAYNTIPFLLNEHIKPSKESPVVIVDLDIDSCGLSYLLGVQADQIKDDVCVQHVLANGCNPEPSEDHIYEAEFLKEMIPVGNKLGYEINEAVLFLPAKDIKNVKKSNNYDDDNFLPRLKSFVEACGCYNVPAIILDSAVGNQATALVANKLASIIVCCMRPTTQFVEGTARYLQNQDSDYASIPGERKCILVPNVVPQGDVIIDGVKYPDLAIKRFLQIFSPFLYNRDEEEDWQYNAEMLDEEVFGIPAVPSFMWREGQLYTQETLDDCEKVVFERYRKLAGIINKL